MDDGCMRDSPEYTGKAGPPGVAVLGVLAVLFTIFLCSGSCLWLCAALRQNSATTVVMKDGRYHELQARESENWQLQNHNRQSIDGFDNWDPAPLQNHLLENKFMRLGYLVSRIFCGFVILLSVVVAILVLMYTPHYPTYAGCNTDVDWNSIIKGSETLNLHGDFQILVSVRNPNRVDLVVHSAEAQVYYKGNKVGYASYDEDWSCPGGSIADVLLVLSLRPSASDAVAIIEDYEAGALYLTVEATLSADVMWGHMVVHSFTTKFNGYRFNANAEGGDRSLCKCPW